MAIIHEEKIVPYTQRQMFDLISNVEDYPSFLPGCSKSEIVNKKDNEQHVLIEVDKNGIKKAFTTSNLFQKHEKIEIKLIEGPFQSLNGSWRFNKKDDQSTNVVFDLEFKLENSFLDMMVGPIVNQMASKFISVFSDRAKELYE